MLRQILVLRSWFFVVKFQKSEIGQVWVAGTKKPCGWAAAGRWKQRATGLRAIKFSACAKRWVISLPDPFSFFSYLLIEKKSPRVGGDLGIDQWYVWTPISGMCGHLSVSCVSLYPRNTLHKK